MVVGPPGREMCSRLEFGITLETTVTTDVDVCMARSAIRKGAIESGVVGKILDWVEGSRQKITNE